MEGKIILVPVNLKFYCSYPLVSPPMTKNLFQLNPAGESSPSNCPKLLALFSIFCSLPLGPRKNLIQELAELKGAQ
jgi:hypothetical protein